MNARKILGQVNSGSLNVRFADFCGLIRGFGFRLDRISGSHHIFVHPNVPTLVNVQNVGNTEGVLTPVQQAMNDEAATQCGFCTVGFVMSMTGFALQNEARTEGSAIAAIDGNICRCTGYKSIERATKRLTKLLEKREYGASPLAYAIDNQLVPKYFDDINKRLLPLQGLQTLGGVFS